MIKHIFILIMLLPLVCHAQKDKLPSAGQSLLDESIHMGVAVGSPSDEEAMVLRNKAVAVASYSWGMQEGTYFRNQVIQQLLSKYSYTLNKMISLGKFIIDGKMLMPTVLEAERIYVKNSDKEARSVNMSYTLDKAPRIVTSPPTWRDYLVRTIRKPEMPLPNEYPRNEVETKIWKSEFKRGWLRGVEQANAIFSMDLNRMRKNVSGLYQFRTLLAQNVVTLPKLTKNKSSVMLLDSGKTINLNDVKYTITVDSRFNKVTEWKPVFNKGGAHEHK